MSAESLSPEIERYALRGGRRAVTVHATGMRHRTSWLGGGEAFVGFDEITDLSTGAKGLRIGTRRGVLLLPRRQFADERAPDQLARSLVERIAASPGGSLQLARMAAVEQLARGGAPLRATAVVMALCVGAWILAAELEPAIHDAGHFGTTLFLIGERWRIITANLLHAGPTHLVLNVLGLWVLGGLVERPLGASRTAVIMGAAALGAMGAGVVAGYEYAVGASGIVCGLAGAVVALELLRPEQLPAAWRIPRRLLVVALGVDAVISAVVPAVAGAAHLGGFAAGALAAVALLPRAVGSTAPSATWLKAAATAIVLVAAAACFSMVREVTGGVDTLARRAERLLAHPEVPAVMLNNAAWMILTGSDAATPPQLEVALRSAQRAVAQSDRSDPNFLDTLAEAQFRAGFDDEALHTIDEAIALAPGETYFVEQRRRFTGERAFDDRPEPPSVFPWPAQPGDPGVDEPPDWLPEEPSPDDDDAISVSV